MKEAENSMELQQRLKLAADEMLTLSELSDLLQMDELRFDRELNAEEEVDEW